MQILIRVFAHLPSVIIHELNNYWGYYLLLFHHNFGSENALCKNRNMNVKTKSRLLLSLIRNLHIVLLLGGFFATNNLNRENRNALIFSYSKVFLIWRNHYWRDHYWQECISFFSFSESSICTRLLFGPPKNMRMVACKISGRHFSWIKFFVQIFRHTKYFIFFWWK